MCAQKILILLFSLAAYLLPLELLARNFLNGWEVEGRVAYFYPENTTFKKIYGTGLAQYQLEYAYRFCKPWSVFGNIAYSNKNGRSIGEHDPTTFHLWPFSSGFKYFLDISCNLEAYLGAGASYSYVSMHDDNPFVIEHVKKKSFGAVGKSGLRYTFCNAGFVDFFIDYYYTKFHFSGTANNVVRNDLNMSGFLFGGGAGYKF